MDFDLGAMAIWLNGHTFSGWSDDADALSLPNIDLANVKRGADGKMIAVSTGEKGGPVVMKFLPTSPSVKFMMGMLMAQLNGASVKWNGWIREPNNQIFVTFINGTLQNAPLGPTIGKGEAKNFEFTWEFERVTPDYLASTL